VEAKNRVPANISKFAGDRMSSTWTDETNLAKIETETKAMQDWLFNTAIFKPTNR